MEVLESRDACHEGGEQVVDEGLSKSGIFLGLRWERPESIMTLYGKRVSLWLNSYQEAAGLL